MQYTVDHIMSLGQQGQLDLYNQFAPSWRKAKFKNKEEGLQALIKVGAVLTDSPKEEPKAEAPKPVETPKKETPAPIQGKAIIAEEIRSIQKRISENRKAPSDPTRPQGVTDAHREHWAKKIKVKALTNPRRPSSLLFQYFEAMRYSNTVGDYLAKFYTIEEKKRASQALSNTIRDGHIELV